MLCGAGPFFYSQRAADPIQNHILLSNTRLIGLREVRIGELVYPIAAFVLGDQHTAAWRCDACESRTNQGLCEGHSAADAIVNAEVAVRVHHATYHRG
jgi:hypothetical protein